MTLKLAQKKLDAWRKGYADRGWAIDDNTGTLIPKYLKREKLLEQEKSKSGFSLFTEVKSGNDVISSEKRYNPEEKLIISGIANEKTTDRMNEVLEPTGVEIQAYLKNSVFLWQHQHSCPIGLVTMLRPEDNGVHFEAWIGDPKAAPLTKLQIEARSLMAQKIIKAVSVGFIPLEIRQPSFNDRGELMDPAVIERWEMLELSSVSVPCNPGALFDLKGEPADQREAKRIYVFPTLGSDGRFDVKGNKPAYAFPKMGEDGKFSIN